MRLDEACSEIVDCEHKTAPIDETGSFFAVGTPAMRGNQIDYAEARRISGDTFASWTKRLPPRVGDLLLAREAPVGPVVLIPAAENVAPGQRTVLLRPDSRKADGRYLYYRLQSPSAQAALLAKAEGSTVHHLNVADIRSFEVDLPPLPEQQAIAEVLGALDDKIAANTKLAATADELIRAEYSALNLDNTVAVGDVAESVRELAEPSETTPETRYVGLEHVPRRLMFLSDSGTAAQVTSSKSRFQTNDVLFGKLRPYFHKVVSAPFDGICSTDILVVRAKDPIASALLLGALASDEVVADVTASSEGTRMPRTSWRDLAAIEIPWPDGEARATISRRLNEVRAATLAALAENRTLAATRDALLPQLMSGKLRVRDMRPDLIDPV